MIQLFCDGRNPYSGGRLDKHPLSRQLIFPLKVISDKPITPPLKK